MLGFFEFDHDQTEAVCGGLFARVTLIGDGHFHEAASARLHVLNQIGNLGPLLLIGRRDFQGQKKTESVDRDMYLGAFLALVAIVASSTGAQWSALQGAPIHINAEGVTFLCASTLRSLR